MLADVLRARLSVLVGPEEWWTAGAGSRAAVALAPVAVGAGLLYLAMLAVLPRWVPRRVDPKALVFVWNAFLTVYSLASLLCIWLWMGADVWMALYPEAWYAPPTRAAIALFCLTKSVEYIDTFWLILRKRPVTLLHGWHHVSVAAYCWCSQAVNAPFGHTFAFVNLCVHTIMYGYFAVTSLGARLPRLRPAITGLQLLQMLVGLGYCLRLARLGLRGEGTAKGRAVPLDGPALAVAVSGAALYLSYAFLFSRFFVRQYTKMPRPSLAAAWATGVMAALAATAPALAAQPSHILWPTLLAAVPALVLYTYRTRNPIPYQRLLAKVPPPTPLDTPQSRLKTT